MKTNRNVLFAIAIMTILLITASCGSKSAQNDAAKSEKPAIVLDTFSTFPDDIVGCSCYFSRDSIDFNKDEYIYMNDLAEISYLKINGTLVKFKQTEYTDIDADNSISKAKSDLYTLTIKVTKGKSVGYELRAQFGTITVTDKAGKSVTSTFYGVCGC